MIRSFSEKHESIKISLKYKVETVDLEFFPISAFFELLAGMFYFGLPPIGFIRKSKDQ